MHPYNLPSDLATKNPTFRRSIEYLNVHLYSNKQALKSTHCPKERKRQKEEKLDCKITSSIHPSSNYYFKQLIKHIICRKTQRISSNSEVAQYTITLPNATRSRKSKLTSRESMPRSSISELDRPIPDYIGADISGSVSYLSVLEAMKTKLYLCFFPFC